MRGVTISPCRRRPRRQAPRFENGVDVLIEGETAVLDRAEGRHRRHRFTDRCSLKQRVDRRGFTGPALLTPHALAHSILKSRITATLTAGTLNCASNSGTPRESGATATGCARTTTANAAAIGRQSVAGACGLLEGPIHTLALWHNPRRMRITALAITLLLGATLAAQTPVNAGTFDASTRRRSSIAACSDMSIRAACPGSSRS